MSAAETWPVTGRIIGIIAGQGSTLKTLASVRQAVLDAGIIPLVIAALSRAKAIPRQCG